MDAMIQDRRVGLALGSGAARGWAHIGVIRAVQDAGFEIAWVAGASMGAVIGAALAVDRLDDVEHLARRLTAQRVAGWIDPVVPVRGLIGGDRITHLIDRVLGQAHFADTRFPFTVVAADLATGAEIHLDTGSLAEAVRASISIPGIFTPAEIDGHHLMDGGLVNPVPVDVARSLGATRVIGVDLNHDILDCSWCLTETPDPALPPPAGAEDGAENGSPLATLERLWRETAGRVREHTFQKIVQAVRPNIFDVMGGAVDIMERQMTRMRLTVHPPDLLIQPPLGHLTLWDFAQAEIAIDTGYQAAREALAPGQGKGSDGDMAV